MVRTKPHHCFLYKLEFIGEVQNAKRKVSELRCDYKYNQYSYKCRGRWVSPAVSVGASASQRCPPDTRTPHRPLRIILPYKFDLSIHFAFCTLHFAFKKHPSGCFLCCIYFFFGALTLLSFALISRICSLERAPPSIEQARLIVKPLAIP